MRGREARRTGRRGERVAARALRRAGYRILARNVRTPHGEVDLVALDGETLVAVEVKTRSAPRAAPVSRLVRRGQARRLLGAGRWFRRLPSLEGRRIRHDWVAVTFDGRRSVVTIRRDVSIRRFARRDPRRDAGSR